MAKWKNKDDGIQEVNMTCIMSTFTDNWKRIVQLRCLMKSLWLRVCPQYRGGRASYQRMCSVADLSLLKNICKVNGVRKTVLQSQA